VGIRYKLPTAFFYTPFASGSFKHRNKTQWTLMLGREQGCLKEEACVNATPASTYKTLRAAWAMSISQLGGCSFSAHAIALYGNLLVQSIQHSLNQPNAFQHSLREDSGPVRLVATGRTVPQQSNGRRFREGAVDEVLLWKEAALVIGEM
jgi:hypothetical protein